MEQLDVRMKTSFGLLALLVLGVCGVTGGPRAAVCSVPERPFGTDFHMHASLAGGGDIQYTPARALLAVQSVGLGRVLTVGNGYYPNTTEADARTENTFLVAEAKKDPTHIAAAIAVPARAEWAVAELRRAHAEGARVLKLHPMASGMDLRTAPDQARLEALLSEAHQLGMTVLIHGNYPGDVHAGEAASLVSIITKHPDLRIIVAHALTRDHALLPQLKGAHVFVDVSALPLFEFDAAQRAALVESLRAFGMEHVLFGSDWPVFHPAEELAWLRTLPITDAEREAILVGNGRALDDLFTR